MNTITVYGIWHRFQQKVYVGYSTNTARRFAAHRNALRRGDHHCIHLQRAWDCDGEAAFDFRPMRECGSKEAAMQLEQDILDAYFKSGRLYNSASSNDPHEVIKTTMSQEARSANRNTRKRSTAVKRMLSENIRKAHTPEAIARRVASTKASGRWCAGQRHSIIATNILTGQSIRYVSLSEAAVSLGASRGNISMCLSGKRKHTKGFAFQKAEKVAA